MKIAALSGSLRKNSWNTQLLWLAKQYLPEEVNIDLINISQFPPYNADEESTSGIPNVVIRAKEQLITSDALLIATPEYNNGIPGVLKNALDWMSRPTDDIAKVFHGKPVSLMGITPGGFGTLLAQTALQPILRYFKMPVHVAHPCYISQGFKHFDDANKASDELKELVKNHVTGFVEFIKSIQRMTKDNPVQ